MKANYRYFLPFLLIIASCSNPNMPIDVGELKIESQTKWHVNVETEQKINMCFLKKYDKDGNLVQQVDYNSLGGIQSKSNFTYGSGTISETKEIFENGDKKEQVLITYRFNSEGKLIKQDLYKGTGELAEETTYTYDENGNLIKKADLNRLNGTLTETIYHYEINENGQMTERKVFNSDSTAYTAKDEFKYDSKNSKLDVYSYGELENFFKLTTYIYDYSGNIIKEIVTDAQGKILEKYSYEYTHF